MMAHPLPKHPNPALHDLSTWTDDARQRKDGYIYSVSQMTATSPDQLHPRHLHVAYCVLAAKWPIVIFLIHDLAL